MKNFRKLSALVLLCAAVLCGCTQSNIVSPTGGLVEGPAVPDMGPSEDVEIDWGEVHQTLRDEFIDPYGAFGNYVVDIGVMYDEEKELLTIMLPVSPKTTGEIAVAYGQAVLKVCGDELATQDFSYEPSEEETLYYGSYFDEHDVQVQIFPAGGEDDLSSYYVNDTMKAGEQRELAALK